MKGKCSFCQKSLQGTGAFCTNCGKKLSEENVESIKRPNNKKKKIVIGTIVGLLIAIIISHNWMKSHYSPESTTEKFQTAILNGDENELTKLLVHEDKSAITKGEAEALLYLYDEQGEDIINELSEIVQTGKFIGLYNTYKIKMVDQFASYDNYVSEMSINFNGENITFSEEDDKIVFGPIIPGKYSVSAEFKSDLQEKYLSDELWLYDESSEVQTIDFDATISDISFYIRNYDLIHIDKSYIEIGKEKIPLKEDGTTEEIGPFVIGENDGPSFKTVIESPLGKVESSEMDIEEKETSLYVSLLDDVTTKQLDEIIDVIHEFSEQYLHALSSKSVDGMELSTSDMRSSFVERFDRYENYTAKLRKLRIDNDVYVVPDTYEPEVELTVQFYLDEFYHNAFEDNVDNSSLESKEITFTAKLIYDMSKEKWLVEKFYRDGKLDEESEITELNGKNKIYRQK